MYNSFGLKKLPGFLVLCLLVSSAPAFSARLQVGAFKKESNLQRRLAKMERLEIPADTAARPRGLVGVRTPDLSDTVLSRATGALEEQGLNYYRVKQNVPPKKETELPMSFARLKKKVEAVMGTQYKWGGETPGEGFDCSGLVNWLFEFKQMPRTVDRLQQWSRPVDSDELKPGNLLFFSFDGGGEPDHVGLYLRDGKFVHASQEHGVVISKFSRDFYQQRFRQAGSSPRELVESGRAR